MKNLLTVLLVLALPSITANAQPVSYNSTCPDAIIDVRTKAEYDAGHIRGALLVPLETIDSGITSIEGISKDSRIMVYCRVGRRSAAARDALEKLGYRHVQDGGAMNSLGSKLKPCTKRPH